VAGFPIAEELIHKIGRSEEVPANVNILRLP
jgi:hypothetical protein